MNWIKPDWPAPPHVHAAVTLRSGGVSRGGYASLNPADHVNDDPGQVRANRDIIKQMLALPSEPVWLRQVHGINVIRADDVNAGKEADASYTSEPRVVCAILTADCLPLLFCGDQGRVIAAAHAGWRGLLAGIIERTLNSMNCKHVQVWLGPAIGPNQFEVGGDVRSAFVNDNPAAAAAFRNAEGGKWLADIYCLARIRLTAMGVKEIYGGDFCTVGDASRFYSHRRDRGVTGRMASLIWRE